MLTYAFDLLYAIYEEEGYEPAEIPSLILKNNLYGIEIDERAGELAAFALSMKARGRKRRFFNKGVMPNICVLENVRFEEGELKNYIDFAVRDLFTEPMLNTMYQFEEANNFGSLIRPEVTDVQEVLRALESKDLSYQLFLSLTHQKAVQAIRQADYLSPKYHVVIANPPYMGSKGMNGRLGAWIKDNYPDNKSDLFSSFIERIIAMVPEGGTLGMMTPFTWMFLGSYEKLRNIIFNQNTITVLVRPEYHAFFESAYVPICGFTLFRREMPEYRGVYIDLTKFYGSELQAEKTLEAIENSNCGWLYRSSANDFKKIPGNPIAYWVSEQALNVFEQSKLLGQLVEPRQGMATTNNNRFLRLWQEVSLNKLGLGFESTDQARKSGKKWFSYNKGGDFRKWYGNNFHVVNYEG
jgi:type II restriction/modification system DNA methylase subunit YeeA